MRTPIVRGVAAAAAALFWITTAHALAADQPDRPGASASVNGVVNVNTANAEELQLLPGIGPSRARAVIEYRKTHGPFKRVEDLAQVSGIGDNAIERIRPHCVLEGKTTANLER